jgi:tetratricopeptide (TPR) repeat protein
MKNKLMIVILGVLFYNSIIFGASTLPPKKIITSSMTQEQIFDIGDEYFKEGNYEDALKVFKRDLDDENFVFGAATVSRLLGRYKESIKYYNILIEKNPEYAESYFGRALSNRGIEEYGKAINDFNKVLMKGPSEYAYVGIGDLYILIGEKGKAKTILDRGVQEFPNSKLLKQLQRKAYN